MTTPGGHWRTRGRCVEFTADVGGLQRTPQPELKNRRTQVRMGSNPIPGTTRFDLTLKGRRWPWQVSTVCLSTVPVHSWARAHIEFRLEHLAVGLNLRQPVTWGRPRSLKSAHRSVDEGPSRSPAIGVGIGVTAYPHGGLDQRVALPRPRCNTPGDPGLAKPAHSPSLGAQCPRCKRVQQRSLWRLGPWPGVRRAVDAPASQPTPRWASHGCPLASRIPEVQNGRSELPTPTVESSKRLPRHVGRPG